MREHGSSDETITESTMVPTTAYPSTPTSADRSTPTAADRSTSTQADPSTPTAAPSTPTSSDPSTPTTAPSTPAASSTAAPASSTPVSGAERRDFADLWPPLTSPSPAAGSTAGASGSTPPAGAVPPTSASPAPGVAGAPPTTDQWRDRARDRGDRGAGPIVIGLLLILGGSFLLARELVPDLRVAQVWPIVVVVVGVVLIMLAFVRGPRQRRR
jgi:hypothetical protein